MSRRKMARFVAAEAKIKILAKIAVNASAGDEAVALVALEHHVNHIVILAVLNWLQRGVRQDCATFN